MKLRELAVPFQAFAALFLCGGMAWMVFVMAGFNPNPPTAMDINARNTQDLSFANMNSTAAALAVQMVSEFVPTQIVLPATETDTVLPTPTLGFVMIPVSGPTLTASPTSASLLSKLFPATKAKEDRATQTAIPRPTFTAQPTATVAFTPTAFPSNTKTATSVPTKPPTSTPPPQPTSTAPLPTNTDSPTDTPKPTNPPDTNTPAPQPTDPVPTNPQPTNPVATNPPVATP